MQYSLSRACALSLVAFLGGCGCELYRSKATASGTAYALDAPEEKFEIRMEWEDVFKDDSLVDATPVEGRVAIVCLSMEPDLVDLKLFLDFGLELNSTQTSTIPAISAGCHATGQQTNPALRTRVRGRIDVANEAVEIDRIEATSTSLRPPEYDLILSGADESGRRYQFDLQLKIERTGDQPSCT